MPTGIEISTDFSDEGMTVAPLYESAAEIDSRLPAELFYPGFRTSRVLGTARPAGAVRHERLFPEACLQRGSEIMKRSEINRLIEEAKALLHRHQMRLPPFAYWSPSDWNKKGAECDEIRQCRLGWDITDFGSGRFHEIGLTVFTVRNGHRAVKAYSDKSYCEKILIVREDQRTPMHYHAFKMEDIICRCGGNLVCQVYHKTPDGKLADTDVEVSLDGVRHRVPAGHKFVLQPGESITLTPFLWHEFWAERGTGTSIVGEVSKTNDDATDNFFLGKVGRFPQIEEDVPPVHLLCTEYG